ncbi:MAG: LysM peptidoglycan-binding domain-containing protein [Cyclobacteriaceae bacterium]|nr:LysM peptidoglycan-binding domain-containing protein [Cyclobacteriaceae bacterium]
MATHIVQPGETLWAISQKYGIKLSSLKAKNRIRTDKDIRAGMVLNLQEHRKRGEDIKMAPAQELRRMAAASNPQPDPTHQAPVQSAPPQSNPSPVTTQPRAETPRQTAPPSSGQERITHVVQQGETLFRLSQRYSVSVEDIKKWNNLPDNTIKVGQRITIIKQ